MCSTSLLLTDKRSLVILLSIISMFSLALSLGSVIHQPEFLCYLVIFLVGWMTL